MGEVVSAIRNIRKQKNISFKETLPLQVINNDHWESVFDGIIIKLGNLSCLDYVDKATDGAINFRIHANEYFIPIQGTVNVEEEIKKLEEELQYLQGFLRSVQKKLFNERFVSN